MSEKNDHAFVFTHWCALSWRRLIFERILALVKLDRVGLAAANVNREVDQVGVGLLVVVDRPGDVVAAVGPSRTLVIAAAFPWRPMSVLQELVVVQFVATGASVALVLRHWVGNGLVHVHVHLGPQHRHVVAWGGGWWVKMTINHKTASKQS